MKLGSECWRSPLYWHGRGYLVFTPTPTINKTVVWARTVYKRWTTVVSEVRQNWRDRCPVGPTLNMDLWTGSSKNPRKEFGSTLSTFGIYKHFLMCETGVYANGKISADFVKIYADLGFVVHSEHTCVTTRARPLERRVAVETQLLERLHAHKRQRTLSP